MATAPLTWMREGSTGYRALSSNTGAEFLIEMASDGLRLFEDDKHVGTYDSPANAMVAAFNRDDDRLSSSEDPNNTFRGDDFAGFAGNH